MFRGTCEKCGLQYFGNALQSARYRICTKCGGKVILAEDKQLEKTIPENWEGTKQNPLG
jgi:DNA-directed RNA polymerase subunit RPC12/RpoP